MSISFFSGFKSEIMEPTAESVTFEKSWPIRGFEFFTATTSLTMAALTEQRLKLAMNVGIGREYG